MWYLRKVASLCEQLAPVSTCLRPKSIKICFQNLGNSRKDKNPYFVFHIFLLKNGIFDYQYWKSKT